MAYYLRARGCRILVAIGLCISSGCTGTSIVTVLPANAEVMVNGTHLAGNSFDYGRWIGNEYKISAAAPGYRPKDVVKNVELGPRAGLIALYSIVSIIGVPNLFALPWYGELDNEIFINLEKE